MRVLRVQSRPRRRTLRRNASFRPGWPPWLVVLRFVRQKGVLPLGLFHDPAVVRHFRRVVGRADFVVEQLAARISHHAQQFRPAAEQLAFPVQLLDAERKGSQEGHKPLRPLFPIHLFMISHRYLEGPASPSVKFMFFRPIKIMSRRTGAMSLISFAPNGATGYNSPQLELGILIFERPKDGA